MPDLTEQLRTWSNSLAESVDPTGLEQVKSTPLDNHSNRRWLAAAASVVVIAVGLFAVATLGNGEADQTSPATNPPLTDATASTTAEVPAGTSPPTTPSTTGSSTTTATSTLPNPTDRLAAWPAAPSAPTPADDIPRLLPTAPISPSGTPVRGQYDGGSSAPPTFTQVFADAERNVLITLQTQPNSIESTPAEMRQPLTIEGWDDAFATAGDLRLVASDPSGFVRLTGSGLDNDEAAAIIASMQRRTDGSPGWDLSPEHAGLVEINGAWSDSAGQRFVTWFDGNRVVAQMLSSPAHTDLISQALGSEFEQVDVNGVAAWFNADEYRRSIVWSPDGTTIVVLGVADERIDPLAVAVSVTEFGVEDYETRTTTEFPSGLGDGCSGSLFC